MVDCGYYANSLRLWGQLMPTELPLWGQFSVVVILVSIIIAILLMFFRGDIATRKQIDQVQKIADTFQKAWETSEHARETAESTNQGQADVLNKILIGQETMARVLDSMPSRPHRDDLGEQR